MTTADNASKISLALTALRARLSESALLHIQSTNGYTELVTFRFNDAAGEEQISGFFAARGWAVPEAYKQFLLLHNGAELFRHPENGGGMKIFSLDQIVQVRDEYGYMFPEHCYPVAMMNSAMILIDCQAYAAGAGYLFWQDCVSSNEEAIDLKMDFATWLELLIIAQGSEFWFWPTFIPSLPSLA